MSSMSGSANVYIVNAFTEALFGGNPAAVVPVESAMSDELMQSIAAQHNLSETAFPECLGPDRFNLRWFTPQKEVPLCGHATLATAYALDYRGDWKGETLTFDTASGEIYVKRSDDGLSIEFPSVPMVEVDKVAGVEQALGISVISMHQPEEDAWQMVCELGSQAEVETCSPNYVALADATALGIAITAQGHTTDFVSRFFIPQLGINEDPVTGSAHCQLTPHWAGKLGKNKLTARQLSSRGGDLRCELKDNRVQLSGNCRLFAEGVLHLPSAE
jgi:PhzF family phenazine biosynthesis protein